MEFLLDVGEGKRERLDCTTCTREKPAACEACPLTHGLQPDIPVWLPFYLRLYQQTKRFNQLPDAGGLLDQDTRTMAVLDLIDQVVATREDQKTKKATAQIQAQQRKAGRQR